MSSHIDYGICASTNNYADQRVMECAVKIQSSLCNKALDNVIFFKMVLFSTNKHHKGHCEACRVFFLLFLSCVGKWKI